MPSTERLRVAVLGAAGRMGMQICVTVDAANDLELVARVGSSDSLDVLTEARAAVAVDVTRPDAVLANVMWCVDHGVSVVVGTSGLDHGALETVRTHVADMPGVGVLVAPNFAVGAVLLMEFARRAAPLFESVEIVELHHPDKADAPSGTARRTAELVAVARRDSGTPPAPDATATALPGARGADVDGVPVHSVRLAGLVASQEVLLGGPGEVLTLRHDTLDRAGFMPGVLRAVRAVSSRPGLTVGLEHVLLDRDSG